MSCYGRDIVEATSKKMNLPVSKISEHEETYSTSLFSMLLPLGSDSIAKQDEIYNVQKEVIREMAEKESCIIVGRCADRILENNSNILKVFIYSDIDNKIKRATTYYGLNKEKAKKEIERIDKQRANHHKYYTGKEWKDLSNYDICINSDALGVEKTADIICEMIQERQLVN